MMGGTFTMDNGPNFFVIGAQRSGTTRLCALLDQHTQVIIPTKEPMFFQSERDMMAKEEWYRQLFQDLPTDAVKGDGSTYYSMCGLYPGTAERIHGFNPRAKVIYMVRHPLRRIESAWAQLLSVGDANGVRGFDYTVRKTQLLTDPSLYWKQLSEYRRFFPDEQIAVRFFEDFARGEAAVVRSCLSFLGVDASAPVDLGTGHMQNASAGKRQYAVAVDLVRALPGYQKVKRLIPQRVKTYGTQNFTRPVATEVRWKDETLQWASELLRPDSEAFLRYMGRDVSYWPMP